MAPINGDSKWNGAETLEKLCSGLAPLLSLFGEQVTRQFLSVSLGWSDHLMLASGPIGIIPVVASAIRIAGPEWLKALIGKGRDEPPLVEKELLSSTSKEVCEAWTGTNFSRTKGLLPSGSITALMLTADGKILDWQRRLPSTTVKDQKTSSACEGRRRSHVSYALEPSPRNDRELQKLREMANAAPNFTLNHRNPNRLGRFENWFYAVTSVALQITAFIISCLIAYQWQLFGSDRKRQDAGFGSYAACSTLLFIGLLGCGYVVDAVTTERTWKYRAKDQDPTKCPLALVWLQRECTVYDQYFAAYAVFNPPPNNLDVRTSTWNREAKDYRAVVTGSAATTVVGFILQLYGRWAMIWIISLVQLAQTLLATGLRSLACRKLAPNPPTIKLTSSQELASLCLAITAAESEGTGDLAKWIEERKKKSSTVDFQWEPVTGRLLAKPRMPARLYEHMDEIVQPQGAPPRRSSIKRQIGPTLNFPTALPEINKFVEATKDSPNLVHLEVRMDGNSLGAAIEGVAAVLKSGEHADILWKTKPIFQGRSDPSDLSAVTWEVPIIRRHDSPANSYSDTARLNFQLILPRVEAGLDAWMLLDRRVLHAALSFWLHTLRAREDSAKTQPDINNEIYTPQEFQRVVGRKLPRKNYDARTLEQWTGKAV